jgi:sigma-B regulation protein RsbU (phosphoserine phosphatase)
VFRPADRTLAYCNAGHPPAMLQADGVTHELDADGPAVGMAPGMTYDTRTLGVPAGATLLVFSDGVFEVEKADGSMWAWSEFAEHIKLEIARGGDISDRLHKYVRELGNSEVLADDFSIVRAAL